jgi:hypothetical protein
MLKVNALDNESVIIEGALQASLVGLIALPARRAVFAAEVATCVATTTSAETTVATIALATEAAILAWFCFVHVQIPTIHFLAIELCNCRFASFF